MVRIAVITMCLACNILALRANATDSVSSYEEILHHVAEILAEDHYALARDVINTHRSDLIPYKTDMISTLGDVTDEHVRRAVNLMLNSILDTRDIPLVLAYAEKVSSRGDLDVRLVLNSLAQRSFYELGPRSFDQWRLWWKNNQYRLDLDASECRSRALASAHQYKEPAGIQRLVDGLERAEGEAKLDIPWALCEIANFASSGRPGPFSVVSPFVGWLSVESEDVKQSAARILGLLGDPQAVQVLLDCLLSDSSTSVKVECTRALKSFGKPSAFALNRALATFVPEEGPLVAEQEVLYNICGALESVGEGESVSYLLSALEHREFHNSMDGWAKQAIKKVGLPGVGFLVEYIGIHELPFDMSSWFPTLARTHFEIRDLVLSQIIDGWGYWDRSVSREHLNGRYTSDANAILSSLIGYLDGPEINKQLGAAICLAWLGNQQAGRFLVSSLQTGDRRHPRMDVIEAVGFTGLSEAVPVLVEILKGEDVHAATMSAQALGDIRHKSAVDGLLEAIDSATTADRDRRNLIQVALYALGRIGDRRALPILLKFAGSQQGINDYVRGDPVRDRRALPVLPRSVAPEQEIRERMRANPICALGYFSEEQVLPTIVSGLSSHAREVRYASVVALETRGDSASVDWLMNALNHEDATLHGDAAEALGRIGDKRAASAIVPLLTRKEWKSRLQAPVALARIGDPSVILALQEALGAPINANDESVRRRIQEAIVTLEKRQSEQTP